jgi:hypothetical protein
MTNSLKSAEEMVEHLIDSVNRSHRGAAWSYELTSEVDNIVVASGSRTGTHTLRIHPCWLRYVVAQGEFQSCVADEIEAWYLLELMTGEVPVISVA